MFFIHFHFKRREIEMMISFDIHEKKFFIQQQDMRRR
jgi:hypothetical protein